MLPFVLASFLAAAADGPRFLQVFSRSVSGDHISWTEVYPSVASAERAAERLAVCGFWRVDVSTGAVTLVPPAAILGDIHLHGLDEGPPPAEAGGELPPPPTVARIVDCAAGAARMGLPMR